jgi:succinate dehydrogenase/fumarate reductase flavoprotein subunit
VTGRADDLPVPRRARRHALDRAPFWAIKVKASITFTAGGLAVDEAMRVLDRFSSASPLALGAAAHQPVPGLFAAGCDCGGFSGVDYLGGLASALVSGRRAGLSASEITGQK